MNRSFIFVVVLVLVLVGAFLLAVDTALGQDASLGAIRGVVLDPNGARVSGASVRLQQASRGTESSQNADGEGMFAFGLLQPDEYQIEASVEGMSGRETVRVEVGASVQVVLRLVIRNQQQVTVAEAPQVVQTQSSEVSYVIDSRAIDDLPLNGRRFTDLSLLESGATPDPRGLTSSSNGDLAFGGVRGYQSQMLVDGGDNNNSFFAQARGRYRAPYQFSNEVVQEFRVSANAYGAELGRSGGAVVNVVTKSGTNQWHGTGFYYLRDSAFNAQHPYTDEKPNDRQHQFGATIGGPLRRNKMFFFAGWDQHVFRVPTEVRFVDGSSQVHLKPGDSEITDIALVQSAAEKLTQEAGSYRSAMLGNAGFLKVDANLTPKHFLSMRLSTSRYGGENNVFLDPSSPVTTHAVSENGLEEVATETANVALTSAFSPRTSSHLRLQFSRDLQNSEANSSEVRVKIAGVLDGSGRSSILPRITREHKVHVSDTLTYEGNGETWKFGADVVKAWIYNFFPSLFGGQYIFDSTRVNPFTFEPWTYGMQISPLRAYAHGVPKYYIQNFGTAESHPDTTEYALFAQDTVRLGNRVALSLGFRWDLQRFKESKLESNPLWPDSGRVPHDENNVAPRVGFAWSITNEPATVLRGGWGRFYTRIPSIYTSSVGTDNGLAQQHLFLRNAQYADYRDFPTYPDPLVSCELHAKSCDAPADIAGKLTTEMSSFAHEFQMPYVDQGSLSLERELPGRLAIAATYLYVHGQHLIRARDMNLPEPTVEDYPVFSEDGSTFTGEYMSLASFGTWQMTRSLSCAFPPCVNDAARLIPELDAINVFESAAESIYHGLTISARRRMNNGFYFRLGFTFAKAIDNGQDALVAGRPATVQNSAVPNDERGLSVTDQRHRFAFSWIYEPKFFHRDQPVLRAIFNGWKLSGVTTIGSGRPVNAHTVGDANRDGNDGNDRLPGVSRNSFTGPGYATQDLRISRRIKTALRWQVDLLVESFNLLNRNNERVDVNDDGFLSSAGEFVQETQVVGGRRYPAQFRLSGGFLKPNNAYAARQVQISIRARF